MVSRRGVKLVEERFLGGNTTGVSKGPKRKGDELFRIKQGGSVVGSNGVRL